ncbi:hypothetical protein PV341_16210 [Streptomyces sp. PA03-1a]|nr:hypothetical protein [Streptomyces sp. PA03-1a]MDX2813337.1 hypothetical protein [Streptomyces sp. PA03-5A]
MDVVETIKACILATMGFLALALPAAIVLQRFLTDRTQAPPHDAVTCKDCAGLRHPSNFAARAALAAMPRPRIGGQA